jgi:HAMP domain-containing protein
MTRGTLKIKRKSIMAFLFLIAIALFFSTGTAFAATNVANGNSSQNTSVITNTTKNIAAGSPESTSTITTNTQIKFTNAEINNASARIVNFVQIDQRLPNYVTISNSEVTMPEFLQLITANLLNINKTLNTSVILKTVNNPTINSTDTVKSGNIQKSEYLNIANSVLTFINANGRAPNCVTTSLNSMNFDNLIYTFSKILNFQMTNQKLPNYVSVQPWTIIIQKNASSEGNIVLRPVYIVSDNINSLQADTARIDDLISTLANLGITAYDMGIGPDTHDSVLSNPNVPSNAVIVEIYGGADAGVIAEKGDTWYKDLLGTRSDFIIYTSGATNITSLAWLPRASDDNYDPVSFTGIADPAQFLLDNGIQYYYGLTTNTMIQCAEAIYKVAAS